MGYSSKDGFIFRKNQRKKIPSGLLYLIFIFATRAFEKKQQREIRRNYIAYEQIDIENCLSLFCNRKKHFSTAFHSIDFA